MLSLPVDAVVPDVTAALAASGAVVVVAPPGSGKSTRIPPALLDHGGAGNGPATGAVLLLQPRRVAAIALAQRIATERQVVLGQEIGYQVRFERRGGEATRLWAMTEGTLSRRLLRDPYLEGVATVIFDEFHERSLEADLCLAWCAELRRTLRPDLRIVVMSATIDAQPIAEFLSRGLASAGSQPGSQPGQPAGPARIIEADGQLHPVQHALRPAKPRERMVEQTVRVIVEALAAHAGDVLAFLPGVGEISAVVRELERRSDVIAVPLHGSLSGERQAEALQRQPQHGTRRRVVVATNVAETSLTVPGVRIVVDSGWARVPYLNAETGLDELRLERISQFSATQRAGRAGREGPGHCYRLWSKLDQHRLASAPVPALHRQDLAQTALILKQLHGPVIADFPWFEPPAREQLSTAEQLLVDLGVVDAATARLSPRGQLIADLPLHPRLSRLVLEAGSLGALELGIRCAALLSEPDLLTDRRRRADPGPADLLDRLQALAEAERARYEPRLRDRGINPQTARRVSQVQRQLRSATADLGGGDGLDQAAELVPQLVLAGWPDRVARRGSETGNTATMVGGQGFTIERSSALWAAPATRRQQLMVAHAVHGLRSRGGKRSILQLGAEVDRELLAQVHGHALQELRRVHYDAVRDRVVAARITRYRDLDLSYHDDVALDPAEAEACLAEALVQEVNAGQAGNLVAADEALSAWLTRVRWLHSVTAGDGPDSRLTNDQANDLASDPANEPANETAEWPAVDNDTVAECIRSACAGCTRKREVLKRNLYAQMTGPIDYHLLQRIEAWAPEQLTLPNGKRRRIRYSEQQQPLLSVQVQWLFGLDQTPRIADGRQPVLLELLAPNQRPVQRTDDLASFWANTWSRVRKDLRGRYPKHAWPENPL